MGGMGGMGWLGGLGWLGEWDYRHKGISSLPHSKLFSVLKNRKVLCFCLLATNVTQKKHFSIFIATINQSHPRIKKCFFVPLVATERNKLLFHFSTFWKALNEEVKCSCVCVISFTHSAHSAHSARSAHLWGTVAPPMAEKVTWARMCTITNVHSISTTNFARGPF